MDKAAISSFYILRSKLFSGGWGDPNLYKQLVEKMKLLQNRDLFLNSFPLNYNIELVKSEKGEREFQFRSPFADYLPGSLTTENSIARFLLVESTSKPTLFKHRPLVIHMARTGDQDYTTRKTMAKRLAKCGVSSIIMLHPFYGNRKPADQKRHTLNYVTDLFVMGGALILESLIIKQWLEKEGYGPLALHGVSLGGFMSSLSATAWSTPVSLIPCLSWTTAAPAFTQGVIAEKGMDWRKLDDELKTDRSFLKEIAPLLEPIIPPTCAPYHQVPNFFAPIQASDKATVKKDSISLSNPNGYPENEVLNDDLAYAHRDMQLLENREAKKVEKAKAVKSKPTAAENKIPEYPLAKQFMYDVMNCFTHLGHYSTPVDPRLVHLVYSKDDQYIPRVGVIDVQNLWPGSQVTVIDKRGHIFSYLMDSDVFELAILQSLSLQSELYMEDPFFLKDDIRRKKETFKEKLQQALATTKRP